jgi:glycosyltransferase involved in cell wall biosynthesis
VIRVWSFITANEGFRRRVLDYMSFMATSTIASLFVRKVDVVVGTSPQFFTACAACMVGFYKRVPFVFELRDLWPESIKAVGAMQESGTMRLLERIEALLYRRAARIVAVTHSFRRTLGSRGFDMAKIDVVTNGVDVARFSPRSKDRELERRLGFEGCFVAGYIGTLGMAHGLETLLQAAQRLQSTPGGEHVRLLMLGDGACKADLQVQAAQMGLTNIVFADSVPRDEVVRWWSLLDVSIIHLRRNELFTTVIPSKLFECMGMGIPVLHGVAGESAEIVEREGVGRVFEPESAEQLVEAVLAIQRDPTLLPRWRANGLAAAARYDRAALAADMLRCLQSVVVGSTKPA